MSSYVQALLADVGVGLLGGLSVYVILSVGQLSLGNAAFMAIGAYVASMLTVWKGWPLDAALLAGAAASPGSSSASPRCGCAASTSRWPRSALAK